MFLMDQYPLYCVVVNSSCAIPWNEYCTIIFYYYVIKIFNKVLI